MMQKTCVVALFCMMICSVLIVLLPVDTCKASGTTIYVDDNGGQDYTSIQDAIDAASSGDTISVYSGTYYENIAINKTINLMGEAREITIIDGRGIRDTIQISADGVSVSGFTIQNGGNDEFYQDNNAGIKVLSSNTTISDNVIRNNEFYGIAFGSFSNNSAFDNIIENNSWDGIYISDSDRNKIYDNTISNNNRSGIQLSYSSNLTIKDNTFISNGILMEWATFIYDWNTHTIENNTVNGRYIRYYKNEDGVIVPDNTGQIILTNCSNFTIQNLNLTDYGVTLGFSSYNKVIANTISTDSYGIYMWSSSYNNFSKNTIIECGIHLWGSSDNNTFSGNNISNGGLTVFKISNSDYNNLDDNVISSGKNSVSFGLYIDKCHKTVISRNAVSSTGRGIQIFRSNNVTIINNEISDNNGTGLHLADSCEYCTVSYNNISSNSYGIYFIDSGHNKIFRNNFINNIDGNAYELRECNNLWFQDLIGNYWDDYAGTDSDSDGIGDTPYNIPSGNNQDMYPLMEINGGRIGPTQEENGRTPGFELIIAVCATALVLFWKRKRTK